MAQELAHINNSYTPRMRAHMPGKYIVLWTVILTVLIGVGAGAWSQREMWRLPNIVGAGNNQPVKAFSALPDILVDLAPDQSGRIAYLKIKIAVAHMGRRSPAETAIEQNMPAIMERVTLYLRALQPEDFQSTEGIGRIKAGLVRRINMAIAPLAIDEIAIEELVIQ